MSDEPVDMDALLDGMFKPRASQPWDDDLEFTRRNVEDLQKRLAEYHSGVESHLLAHGKKIDTIASIAILALGLLVAWLVWRSTAGWGEGWRWVAGVATYFGVAIYYGNQINRLDAKADFPWWRRWI